MITLTINDKDYNIANSYEELSLGQYIDIIKVSESKVQLDSTAADIKVISLLSDSPEALEKILWDFNMDDFKELLTHFTWVNDTTVLEKYKSLEPKQIIEIEDGNYTIINNYNKLSLGEVISFETLLKQENSDLHRLDVAFGLLLRPVVDGKQVKFTQEVFDQIIKIKYKVKVIDIYASISFFLTGEKQSTTKNTKAFSIRKK